MNKLTFSCVLIALLALMMVVLTIFMNELEESIKAYRDGVEEQMKALRYRIEKAEATLLLHNLYPPERYEEDKE